MQQTTLLIAGRRLVQCLPVKDHDPLASFAQALLHQLLEPGDKDLPALRHPQQQAARSIAAPTIITSPSSARKTVGLDASSPVGTARSLASAIFRTIPLSAAGSVLSSG